MKCQRCGAEMQRRKIREHSYQYRCSKCGYVVGTRQEEKEDKAYADSYAQAMGKG